MANDVGRLNGKNLQQFTALSCPKNSYYIGFFTLISQSFAVKSEEPDKNILGSPGYDFRVNTSPLCY